MTVRCTIKHLIEQALQGTPVTNPRVRRRSVILSYHNIVPDGLEGLGDDSLHLPLSAFRTHLDVIRSYGTVVPLADILSGSLPTNGPAIAITFDDAYRGAVKIALPLLDAHRLPSTLFVAPGLLGRSSFWWDALSSPPTGLDPSLRHWALTSGEGREARIRLECNAPLSTSPLPDCYGGSTEAEVQTLARYGTITLGAHSWSHANLSCLDVSMLSDEMERPLEWLQSFDGPVLPVVAYPYGLANPSVELAAKTAGYSAGLYVNGGWFNPAASLWQVARLNIPAGMSASGLAIRLRGLVRLA